MSVEKWFELVSYFKPDESKEVKHKGQRIFICGDVGDVTIVQVGEVYGNQAQTMARIQAANEMMKVMEIDKGLVVTDSMKFVKMKEVVDQETLAQLKASQETRH